MGTKLETAFTAIVSCILITIFQLCNFDDNLKKGLSSIAAILAPFLASYFFRLYNKFDQPSGLVKYKAGLERDLKRMEKQLKSKYLSKEAKKEIKESYASVSKLLAKADSNYLSGKLDPAPPKDDQ